MNPFASYRAINTKLHARKKTLLNEKEWQKSVEFKSVSQISEFLKKRQGYKSLVGEFKIDDLHREDLEVILERYIVKEIESMLHYYSGSYKQFFKTFLIGYEINDLQMLLRGISKNENLENIERYFVHSSQYGLPIYSKLTACKTVVQFIDMLKGTIYYDVLKTMVQEDVIKREFHMEMKLYMLYYRELMETAEKLGPKDRRLAKDIIGTQIDFVNVQWIYRAVKYYDISPEEMLIYSLPFGNKITYPRLKALCYAKNLEEFKKLTNKYLSVSLFDKEDDTFLDRVINKHLFEYTTKLNDNEESIAASLAYIYTLYIEVQDLVALIEGVRYTLPENELRKYLVHTI